MKTVEELVREYLRIRRSMGFKLIGEERMLLQFAAWLNAAGKTALTSQDAVAWAVSAGGGRPWHSARLSTVRQFTRWASAFDPSIEVPRTALLPSGVSRAVPYIYTDEQIRALLDQAAGIRLPLTAATYQTLIGLLACTGLRGSEAIRANTGDLVDGVLTITDTKFGKSRLVPLHESVTDALAAYRGLAKKTGIPLQTEALLVSSAGNRLVYSNVQHMFWRLTRRAGITERSSKCRPRLHDLRHTFAVNTMNDAYRDGRDPAEVLAVLSTYLGHVSPKSTYWYLQATPELLGQVAARLEVFRSPSGGRG